jgi:23S rRNA pseudouridine2605 synthase
LARIGVCSRRQAEILLKENRVQIDGASITSPTTLVTPGKCKITIDNKELSSIPPPTKVWLHNKKTGVIVTEHDPAGRPALFPILRQMGVPPCVSVGRLDYNTEGLLLLTNNGNNKCRICCNVKGDLARFLEHPSSGFERKYKVKVHGTVLSVFYLH